MFRIAALLLTVAVSATGCGNWVESTERVGRIGATLDDAGNLVLVVAPCSKGTAKVLIARGRTPDMPDDQVNETVGEWTAQEATDQQSSLNLGFPSLGWEGDAVEAPDDGELWIVDGTFVDEEDSILSGPSLTRQELDNLAPGELLTESGPEGRTEFDGRC